MTAQLGDVKSHRREKGVLKLGMARLSDDRIAAKHPVAGRAKGYI
jgi:hypothetical protein